jgi:hypothetical protein
VNCSISNVKHCKERKKQMFILGWLSTCSNYNCQFTLKKAKQLTVSQPRFSFERPISDFLTNLLSESEVFF